MSDHHVVSLNARLEVLKKSPEGLLSMLRMIVSPEVARYDYQVRNGFAPIANTQETIRRLNDWRAMQLDIENKARRLLGKGIPCKFLHNLRIPATPFEQRLLDSYESARMAGIAFLRCMRGQLHKDLATWLVRNYIWPTRYEFYVPQ